MVSLPSTYPASSPPQLQLLSRYIGPFGVDSKLFGSILRTYISQDGIDWVADSVCVFDGLEWVKEHCVKWYETKKSEQVAGELLREDERHQHALVADHEIDEAKIKRNVAELETDDQIQTNFLGIPKGVEMFVAEPISDRKSAFVGRAFRISNPSQIPGILAYLMSDRRISRAAHPIINAWRCKVGPALHQDNDDDGETAAGGRLAHLLSILEVDNVLIVVTRYFGGILLGADRFKHINQAARNALDLGGFLEDTTPSNKRHTGRGKKR